jgi:hypothetical protein
MSETLSGAAMPIGKFTGGIFESSRMVFGGSLKFGKQEKIGTKNMLDKRKREVADTIVH